MVAPWVQNLVVILSGGAMFYLWFGPPHWFSTDGSRHGWALCYLCILAL